MNLTKLPFFNATILFVALGITVQTFAHKTKDQFITSLVPGAHAVVATSINPSGEIIGFYLDANNMDHGFVRAAKGTITTFDTPVTGYGINPVSINPSGVITGFYFDANSSVHGFVRDRYGTITTLDLSVPGCPVAGCLQTEPVSINPSGVITGLYYDPSDPSIGSHGFVRAADGTITTFDVGLAPSYTTPVSINPSGVITGHYFDASSVSHGFVRAADGTITTFDFPGAVFPGTYPTSINPSGVITGSSGGHGFVRDVDGTITTFDAGPCCTGPSSINPSGVITGWYFVDVISSSQGFVRYPDHHEGPENELDDEGGEGSANPE